MATGAVRGRKCRIKISSAINTGGTIFNEVRNWSINPTQEMIDASSADSSGWNEFIPGQRGFVFRAETVYSPAAPSTGSGSVGAARDISRLMRALIGGVGLYGFSVEVDAAPVSGSTNSGQWLAGAHSASTVGQTVSAYVTNARVGGKYNDIQLFEFEVTGSRALVYTS